MIRRALARIMWEIFPWSRGTFAEVPAIEKVHRLPRAQLDEYVQGRLTAILRRAAAKVPYYAAIFKERGWDPARAEAYWADWPVLTQSSLQEHREQLVATDVNKRDLRVNTSGGSSGLTKTFYQSRAAGKNKTVAAQHSDSLAGWRPGCRTAFLWGAPGDVKKGMRQRTRLAYWLQNAALYDSFDMGPAKMATYHEDMTRHPPDVIVAYAGSAFEFARFLKQRGITPTYPGKGIVVGAETLTSAMRSVIEGVFRKPVFNRYGSRETSLMAFECAAHAGLHVACTVNLLEVVRSGSAEPVWDQEGDILVTTLAERDCPLIRYRIGDVGVMTRAECTCGRSSMRLSRLLGRETDFITAPDGSRIHGEYFTHAFYGLEKVRQFRMVQRRTDLVEVRMVLSEALTAQEKEKIVSGFRHKLGPSVAIEFQQVDRIEPLPSGKRGFTLSNVDG